MKQSFETLFDRYSADVFRYVRRRTSINDVDDVVAEVFLTAWRRFNQIPEGFELPWLYRTAWNVLANLHRKHIDVPFDELPDEPFTDDVAATVIADDQLRRVWAQLPLRDQEVLRLSLWEGLDGRELAEALGISVGGAGAALFRARERFAKLMAEQ